MPKYVLQSMTPGREALRLIVSGTDIHMERRGSRTLNRWEPAWPCDMSPINAYYHDTLIAAFRAGQKSRQPLPHPVAE